MCVDKETKRRERDTNVIMTGCYRRTATQDSGELPRYSFKGKFKARHKNTLRAKRQKPLPKTPLLTHAIPNNDNLHYITI